MKKKRCVKRKVFHSKKIKITIFTIIFLMFSTVLFLKVISNKTKDIFIHIAEEETKRLASIVVSNSVTKNVLKYLDTNTIFIITRGENNRIQTVDLDTEIVNKILLESAKIVSKNLTYLQKGMLEKNHEFIRYILPKGSSFKNITQEDCDLFMNNINSLCRDSLNGKSPYEAMLFLCDEYILKSINCYYIKPDEVILNESLLKY